MAGGSNSFFDWLSLLQGDDELAYYANLYGQRGRGLSPMQRGYFSQNYGDVSRRYLGDMGQSLERAHSQGLSPEQFLEQNPDQSFHGWLQRNPLEQQYRELPPSLRPGSSTARFAPPVRWMR